MNAITSWFLKHRYMLLCLSVFGLMCFHTMNGQWVGDFWDYSAAIRELTTHILHPKHPHLLLDAPHHTYSPYTVVLAAVSRVLHFDAVTTLSIAGLVNLGLFFFGLRLFVFALVPTEHRDAAVFYTLLLILLWWGSRAWLFSGFFHIGVLGYVLPYPSTFAVSLSLIVLGMNETRLETRGHLDLVIILLSAVTILITHPVTFQFFAAGLVARAASARGSVLSKLLVVGGLLILAFLLAAFWPYFPMLKLMSKADLYHWDNRDMYEIVLTRIWPSLIGVPLIIAKMRSNWRHPLVLMLVLLSGLYVFGAVSGKYTYGRNISCIVLLLQIAIAERLAALESKMDIVQPSTWIRRLIIPASVAFLSLVLSFNPLKDTLLRAIPQRQVAYEPYLFLSRFTGQYDVIVSDIHTSWVVPTFGGKVVAAKHNEFLIADDNVRRSDLDYFFKKDAKDRLPIIEKYGARYVLLNKSTSRNWQEINESFMPLGKIIFQNNAFVLIWLNPSV